MYDGTGESRSSVSTLLGSAKIPDLYQKSQSLCSSSLNSIQDSSTAEDSKLRSILKQKYNTTEVSEEDIAARLSEALCDDNEYKNNSF